MGRRSFGTPNLFLRKHRKRLLSSPSFRTKWLQFLDQKEALQSLKRELENSDAMKTDLLSFLSTRGIDPNPQSYFFLIKHLTRNLHFHQLPSVLQHLQNNESFQTPEYIFTHLIRILGNSERIEEAVHIFYRIPKFKCVPTANSLSALLSVLCRSEVGLRMVPEVLLDSRKMGIRLEESSLRVLINSLCRINKVRFAVELFNSMKNDGFCIDDEISSLLLSAVCFKSDLGDLEVMGFFEALRKMGFCPGIGDYTNVIRFLVKKRKGEVALDALNQMINDGIKPDVVCYTMVLNGVILEGDFVKADQVFDELLVLGLVPDVYTYNAHIDGLCKRNEVEQGVKMVAYMEELGCRPNVITYNILLDAFCREAKTSRAMGLLREMESKDIQPNWRTYKVVIKALVDKGDIARTRNLVEEVFQKRISHRNLTCDQVISCLCQRGFASEAVELVLQMDCRAVYPGARAWEALLVSSGLKLEFAESTWTDLVGPI